MSKVVTLVFLIQKIIKKLQTIKVGKSPYAIAFLQDGSKAFVTNQHENTISIIDTLNKKNIKTLKIGEYPEGINFYIKTKEVLIVNCFDSEVVILNSMNLNIKKRITVGEGPRGFGNFIGPNLTKN